MSDETKSESQNRDDAVGRPLLTSYDSGYEHSLDYWIKLQHLVREAESGFPPPAFAVNRRNLAAAMSGGLSRALT